MGSELQELLQHVPQWARILSLVLLVTGGLLGGILKLVREFLESLKTARELKGAPGPAHEIKRLSIVDEYLIARMQLRYDLWRERSWSKYRDLAKPVRLGDYPKVFYEPSHLSPSLEEQEEASEASPELEDLQAVARLAASSSVAGAVEETWITEAKHEVRIPWLGILIRRYSRSTTTRNSRTDPGSTSSGGEGSVVGASDGKPWRLLPAARERVRYVCEGGSVWGPQMSHPLLRAA